MRYLVMIAVALTLAGCISLSRTEKEHLRTIRAAGFSDTEEKVKHPGAAGALNILPGFGNFYLAIGTDESEQWIVGFMNLLFWPLSVVWGIPEGAIDAINLNKRETVYYFTRTDEGRERLQQAQQGGFRIEHLSIEPIRVGGPAPKYNSSGWASGMTLE